MIGSTTSRIVTFFQYTFGMEKTPYHLRLLIKRPSWGYSPARIKEMGLKRVWEHMLNPMHDVAGTGGIYIQLEDENSARTFIYRPMTTLSWAAFAVSVVKSISTLGTTPGRVFEKKPDEPLIYDDEMRLALSKEQYDGILASLERGKEIVKPIMDQGLNVRALAKESRESLSTFAYNYFVNDSTLFAVRLLSEHGVPLPDSGYIAPFNYYKRIIRMEHSIPVSSPLLPAKEIQCVLPRSLVRGTPAPEITSFGDRLKLERLENTARAAGGVC